MSSIFDVESARSKFPSLNQGQVFLDNAGGSQVLGSVVDSIRDYLLNTNVQLGASYRTGRAATERYKSGIAAGARYINAGEEEIVFGASTTQLFRNLSYALEFHDGDEIIVSGIDHEANVAPWLDLAERQKLVLKWWTPQPSSNPKLLPEDLKALLSPKTRLVTCTHASNILGTITDIRAIADTVHTVPGALLCTDGVAYTPHRPLDMKKLAVDFYAFSWYKVYGPHIAMLYASRGAQQAALRSLGHFFKPSATLEDKIGLAGASYELTQAVPAVVDYLGGPEAATTWDGIARHEESLQALLLAYLNSRPDTFTVYGETSADVSLRVCTIAFTVQGWSSKDLVEAAETTTNFGFRWGAFYSNRLVNELLGLKSDGVVRVSMVHYNTVDEVSRLIETLDKIVSGASGIQALPGSSRTERYLGK